MQLDLLEIVKQKLVNRIWPKCPGKFFVVNPVIKGDHAPDRERYDFFRAQSHPMAAARFMGKLRENRVRRLIVKNGRCGPQISAGHRQTNQSKPQRYMSPTRIVR